MSVNLQGWAGEDEAARAWDALGDLFMKPQIAGQQVSMAGRTFRGWEIVRKLTGSDLRKVPQETGDCVAVSTADLINLIQHIEIAAGDPEEFHPIHPSFLYATSRCLIGQNQLKGRGAGSVGSWMARAAEKFGCLRADLPGVPAYSGRLSDEWGDDRGQWKAHLPAAANHLIGAATRLTDWSQLVEFVNRGYLATIASSLGFENTARSDGYHRRSGTWNHQMGIWGVSDDPKRPWVAISNQWGDTHGRLTDFETGQTWPAGMLRVRPEDIATAFTRGEVFAYSTFAGFPDRDAESWKSWVAL